MFAFVTSLKGFVTAIRRGVGDARFRAMAVLVAILLASGTIFYWRFEDWSILDSLYFSVITLTTVGYGDLAPTTAPTKVFTIVYILMGLGVLLAFLSMVASHAVESRMEKQEAKRGRGAQRE